MTIAAVLPVRGLVDGKLRLARIAHDHLRMSTILMMLRNALDAISQSDRVDVIAVISPDPLVVEWVARFRPEASRLMQRSSGLNPALDEAAAWARKLGADAVLALNPDLPLIGAADVRDFVSRLDETPDQRGMVVAPDLAMRGTNALLVRPIGAVPFQFGDDSFQRHRASARQNDVPVTVVWPNALSFDLDTPEDVERLRVFALGRWVALSNASEDARFLSEHFPDHPSSPPEAAP